MNKVFSNIKSGENKCFRKCGRGSTANGGRQRIRLKTREVGLKMDGCKGFSKTSQMPALRGAKLTGTTASDNSGLFSRIGISGEQQ